MSAASIACHQDYFGNFFTHLFYTLWRAQNIPPFKTRWLPQLWFVAAIEFFTIYNSF
jgi:hypothetical protein